MASPMPEQIIDSCCLITLYASGEEAAICQACGGFWISDQVRAEALRIRRDDEDAPTGLVSQDIDLAEAIANGYVHSCRLGGLDELNAFMRFAIHMDDGEASCLAIAQSRGWTVATDDRKTRRIASECDIRLISTPEIVRRWVETTFPSKAAASQLLQNIERFARFRPRRTDPLYQWWIDLSRDQKQE